MQPKQFETVHKNQLWYDRYQYVLRGGLKHVSILRDCLDRNLSGTAVHDIIRNRAQVREEYAKTWGSVNNNWRVWTPDIRFNLHDFADKLMAHGDYKLTVSLDSFNLYANDVDWLDTMANLRYVFNTRWAQASVVCSRDTVLLKSSEHVFRTFFRSFKSVESSRLVYQWLNNLGNEIKMSPSLSNSVHQQNRCIRDYYFFDHSDIRLLQVLGLVNPKSVRTTLKINSI